MTKTKIQQLSEYGQSIWLDYISRSMIDGGKLNRMIDLGVLGMTSNPTIFNQAISSSNDYDERIIQLREEGKSTFEIYDALTIKDIQDAADLFYGTYEETGCNDGYVSLEINPQLADKKEESVQEGLRLFGEVNRPNLMIKIPVTKVGTQVIEELIAHGINVNATLIFSPRQYWEAASAYLKGLERFKEVNQDLSVVRSVASVFVSRIDTAVDKLIEKQIEESSDSDEVSKLQSLKGKAAVANSQVIFDKFNQMFSSNYFDSLAESGAKIQRVLWASTGTKNPAYSDIKYITELICKPTVNTLPEKTLNAFLDHGEIKEALPYDINEAQEIFNSLNGFSIDIDEINSMLLRDGVAAFVESFDDLLNSIEAKIENIYARS